MSAILGPEMAAPILWTPGKNAFFLQESLHVHKIPRLGGGGFWVWGWGGSADFIFMGAGIFLREDCNSLAFLVLQGKEIARLGALNIARFAGEQSPQPQRIARFWCTQFWAPSQAHRHLTRDLGVIFWRKVQDPCLCVSCSCCTAQYPKYL